MKNLFFCSTAYHVLIALVKSVLTENETSIVLTGYIPGAADLLNPIKESRLVESVFFVEGVEEYQSRNKLDALFHLHRKNSRKIRNQLPFDIEHYDSLYVFHEKTWFTRYLQDSGAHYTLCEDALDFFKIIDKTSFFHMLPKKGLLHSVKKILRYHYFYSGDYRFLDAIEVNNDKDLLIPAKKVVCVPRNILFERLTAEHKEIIYNIFTDRLELNIESKSVLLLTQPLAFDGFVRNSDVQLTVYEEILKIDEFQREICYLKPHPRDEADYSSLKYKGRLKFIDKTVPMEIFDFKTGYTFDLGLTISSTAIRNLKCVKEKKILGLEFLDNVCSRTPSLDQ